MSTAASSQSAVTAAFLAALEPAALQACLAAAEQLEQGRDTALQRWRRQASRPARYNAALGGVSCGRLRCAGWDGAGPVTAAPLGTVVITRPRRPLAGRELR